MFAEYTCRRKSLHTLRLAEKLVVNFLKLAVRQKKIRLRGIHTGQNIRSREKSYLLYRVVILSSFPEVK